MKTDLEGFELRVLRGAETLLSESCTAILLEAAETDMKVERTEQLTQRGYRHMDTTGFEAWHLLFTTNGALDDMPA